MVTPPLTHVRQERSYHASFLLRLRIWGTKLTFRSTPSLEQRILFFTYLQHFLEAKFSVVDALSALAQVLGKPLGPIASRCAEKLERGIMLSRALAGYRGLDDKVLLALIGAGETSGQLMEAVIAARSYLREKAQFRKMMMGVSRYPLIVLVCFVASFWMLSTVLLPQVIAFIPQEGAEPSWTTQSLLWFYHNDYIFLWGGCILGLLMTLFILLLRVHWGQLWGHRLIMRVPFCGRLWVLANWERFFRTLHLLSKAHISTPEALRISTNVMRIYPIHDALKEARLRLIEGESLSSIFKKIPGILPTTIGFLDVMSQTEDFEKGFDHIALFYHAHVSRMHQQLEIYTQPLSLLILGGLLGWFILGALTPLYEIGLN
jgi:type II secretory pathway component PulF